MFCVCQIKIEFKYERVGLWPLFQSHFPLTLVSAISLSTTLLQAWASDSMYARNVHVFRTLHMLFSVWKTHLVYQWNPIHSSQFSSHFTSRSFPGLSETGSPSLLQALTSPPLSCMPGLPIAPKPLESRDRSYTSWYSHTLHKDVCWINEWMVKYISNLLPELYT